MKEGLIAAIDCGTQSARVLLFDCKGNLVAKMKSEFEPYVSAHPGWAEQNPEVYFDAICQACNELALSAPEEWSRIIGVVLTTQRDTCVPVDKDGNALRPAIVWLDQRMAECDKPYPLVYRLGFGAVGMLESAELTRKKCKSQWISENEPDVWEKMDKYLLLSGWLNHRLTGNMADSTANQIGHIPFNYKHKRWPVSKLDYRWYMTGLSRRHLPKLVRPADVIGTITPEASEATGFPVGTRVYAGGSDKGCETLGTGCLDPSSACISLGTMATLQVTTENYMEPIKFMPAYPAVVPGRFNPEIQIYRGYWMINWFKQEFGHREELIARERGVAPEVVLNELLDETPPGSMGLMLQPYWGAGLKIPEARGAVIGFGDIHTRAHIYRSIVEGIAYALRDAADRVERVSGTKIERIMISGGGSQADSICQITADVFNRPVLRGETYEGSGLGAAIIGFCGAGCYSTFDEAVANMVEYEARFNPDPANVEIYDKLYRQIYKKMYARLKPLYEDMRTITGYPE